MIVFYFIFFIFFLDKKNEIQKYLIKTIISKIDKNKEGINFNIENILNFFKYCVEYEFELKKLN